MTQKIIPFLWFDSQAEEAAKFYVSVFAKSRVLDITKYGKASAEASGQPQGSVLTVDFEIEGQRFVALNGGPVFKFTPAISLYVRCDSAEEVNKLYLALSPGGGVMMALDKYPFSERYAWITDRYGVSWQLFCGEGTQKIAPCLMFAGKQNGRAVEAIKFYTSLFDNSKVNLVAPYEKGEGQREGAVKHAAFSLDGVNFVAMDSHVDHAFTFTPAISFLVNCEDQKEVDRFWLKLSAVPEAEQCGWLQDRYGVSWQIVPEVFRSMVSDKDPVRSERVMSAMIQMKKLDIEALSKAYGRP